MNTRLTAAQRRAILGEMLARARQLGAAGVPLRAIVADVALLRDDLVDASRQGLAIRPTGTTATLESLDRTEREDPHV